MDPASILGVIGVTAQILKLLHVYSDGVAECRDEVAALRVELFCLKSALTQIEKHALLLPTFQSDEFYKMLTEARAVLIYLAESLQPEASRAQRLAQRLTWPLKRQHVKDTTIRLERIKTYFILVATNDLYDVTGTLATSLEGVQQSLAELKTSQEDKATQDAANAWLTNFDPEPAHQAAISTRVEGTNGWFLDEILRDWAKGPIQLLRLRGKPGSGKTCIAAACTSRLMDTQADSYVSHYYCSYNSAESQKPRTVLASLLRQLTSKDLAIQRDVIQAYKENLRDQHSSAAMTASLPTLSQLAVRICTETPHNVFFVIDAIDEAGDGSKDILQALLLVASQSPRFRIVLTSTESMTELVQEVSDELKISSMNAHISPANVNGDIDLYVQTRFSKSKILSKLRPELQARIQEKIKQDHNGSFRWAQCTIDDLSYLPTPNAIKHALASITPSLSNVYKAVISSIPKDVSGIAWSMLMYLVSALRPLTLRELAEAAVFLSATDFSEDDRLIDPLSVVGHLRCLVRYEPNTDLVELAHSSVRAFLTSQDESGDFYIEDIAAYRSMCRVCIEYLVLPSFPGPCPNVRGLGQRRRMWPFLRYATELWIEHVRLLGPALPSDVEETIFKFFDSAERGDGGHFAAWYQGMYPERGLKTWATKPLYTCAREGLTGLLSIILPKMTKEQLEVRGGSRGSTALHVAGAFGEVEAVRLLLKAGADPNERNDHGENGIQWAWFWGHIATVEALLEGGADRALIQWDPNLGRRTTQKWEAAEMVLRDLQRRQDLGLEVKLRSLPMHLAALMSPQADELTLKKMRQELASQDFKIPPRAQLRSNPHSDQLDTLLKEPI